MTTAEIISLCSLGLFSTSLTLSAWSIAYQVRSPRVAQTGRSHEAWWTTGMKEMRDEVFAMRKAMPGDDSRVKPPAAYHPAARLIDKPLTCRLIDKAHHADYLPLIGGLREELTGGCLKDHPLPHWMQMTAELGQRFARIGKSAWSKPCAAPAPQSR